MVCIGRGGYVVCIGRGGYVVCIGKGGYIVCILDTWFAFEGVDRWCTLGGIGIPQFFFSEPGPIGAQAHSSSNLLPREWKHRNSPMLPMSPFQFPSYQPPQPSQVITTQPQELQGWQQRKSRK